MRHSPWTSFAIALVAPICAAAQGGRFGVEQLPADVPRFAWIGADGVSVRDGGSVMSVPETADIDMFAWDRDRAIVGATRTSLVRIDIETGTREVVVDGFKDARFPDVCPRTRRIAFAAVTHEEGARWQVYVCGRDGSQVRRVAPGYDPVFHPDGRLLFEVHDPNPRLVWVDLDDTEATPTALLDDRSRRYTVSCDRRGRLAWSEEGALFVADGGVTSRISPEENDYDRFASFSPDGRWLIFFRSINRAGDRVVVHDLVAAASHIFDVQPGKGLAAFAPRAVRGDLIRIARAVRSPPARERPLSRRSPGSTQSVDWPRSLWVERAVEAGEALAPRRRGPSCGRRRRTRSPQFDVEMLFLPDLRWLDPETAGRLGARGKQLWLDGLRDVDRATVDALVETRRSLLALRGLTSLTPDVADGLATMNGSVLLGGVTSIDAAAARALSKWAGYGERYMLSLSGLVDLDVEIASILAETPGWGLSLSGLRVLDSDVRDALAKWPGAVLDLDGIEHLTTEDVDRLLHFNAKWVELGGLRRCEPADRARLERSDEPLFRFAR